MFNHRPSSSTGQARFWLWLLPWLLLACQLTGTSVTLPADDGPSAVASPESAPSAARPAPVNRIVFLGTDRNLYTIAPDSSERVALTEDADGRGSAQLLYQHMTWSPASDQIAFVGLATAPGQVSATLQTIAPDGAGRQTLFASDDIFPFYLYWSPDGARITFLSNLPSQNDLGLYQFDFGIADFDLVEQGQPFYWVWSPDSSQIFLHTGARLRGRLALLDANGEEDSAEFGLAPTAFQAPGWTPDGDQLLTAIEKDEGMDALVLLDRTGTVTQELADLPRDASFILSPDGSSVAYTVRDARFPAGSIGALSLLSLAEPGNAYALAEPLVVAYFWSPNSRFLLYFALNRTGRQQTKPAPVPAGQEGSLLFDLYIHDLSTRQTVIVDTIEPTRAFMNVVPYFDQYHHSATIWSPDSRSFVYPSRFEGEDTLWIGEVAGGLPRELAKGRMAYWSWR